MQAIFIFMSMAMVLIPIGVVCLIYGAKVRLDRVA
jgi:hypothetical protein